MAEYTLPDLDYDYGALEPHISGQINELHHGKHHATYVKGANDALAKLAEAREKDNHSAIFLNEKNLAFHLGGPDASVACAEDKLVPALRSAHPAAPAPRSFPTLRAAVRPDRAERTPEMPFPATTVPRSRRGTR